MALTFAQARTIIQQAVADSSNDTFIDQCLNQAQREVAMAKRWPELIVRDFFTTYAAYETGTVAVTNGGTTWTLTGGTFPTTAETGAWRIALTHSGPWYEVETRTDGTNIETDAYQGTTVTASDFIIYKSHYSLAPDVDRVEELWLHEEDHMVPLHYAPTDESVTEFLHYPSGPGTPTHYYNMERDTSGNRQVLLGPETPDDTFRVEYTYRKQVTDDTFSGNLDESRWPVIVARAKALAYEPEFYERSIVEMRRFRELLDEEWARASESETASVRVGDSRVRYPASRDYLDSLMGYGRVQDPS